MSLNKLCNSDMHRCPFAFLKNNLRLKKDGNHGIIIITIYIYIYYILATTRIYIMVMVVDHEYKSIFNKWGWRNKGGDDILNTRDYIPTYTYISSRIQGFREIKPLPRNIPEEKYLTKRFRPRKKKPP